MTWLGRHKLLSAAIAAAALWMFASVSGSIDDQPVADDHQSESAGDDFSATDHDDDPEDGAESEDSPKPKSKTYLVVHVVDGDTIHLGNGDTVRLGGIDAPEVGECGYKRARNTLAGLVLGKRVTLGATDEDRDQYGRLLRYVDVGRTDAGLRLIEKGLAIAKYDSRDGYGFHPREPAYIKADRASPPFVCAKPVPLLSPPQEKKNCAPGYSPCVRPYPPDLDCADIGHSVRVTGRDPHGLDRDGDGTACEWS